jgi:hypothetical protein
MEQIAYHGRRDGIGLKTRPPGNPYNRYLNDTQRVAEDDITNLARFTAICWR